MQNFIEIEPGDFSPNMGEIFFSSSMSLEPRPYTDIHAKYVKRRGSA